MWKSTIKQKNINLGLLTLKDHHIIRNTRIVALEKLNSQGIYWSLIAANNHKPTSQIYFEKLFPDTSLNWKNIYLVARKVTTCTYLRCFQYKILTNTLYLNKKLFLFKKSKSPLCSFCRTEEETVPHLFYSCPKTQSLWLRLKNTLARDFSLPLLTPQAASFCFLNIDTDIHAISNHILLIFKLYIYQSRESNALCFNHLFNRIIEVKRIEKQAAVYSKSFAQYTKKWQISDTTLNT